MMLVSIVAEAFVYVCLAILMGSFILQAVPSDLEPTVRVPFWVKLSGIIGIMVFSFIPLLSLLFLLLEDYSFGYVLTTVLFTFEVGKAWVVTFCLSVIIAIYLLIGRKQDFLVYHLVGVGLVFLLIATLSWTSHANSVYGMSGYLTHLSHYLTVVVWVGIVFIVGWFSKDTRNWLSFLDWFHITAIFCLAIIAITGLSLMGYSMDYSDYPASWLVPYGHSLLIKHVLMIPLVLYAGVNGVLMKRRIRRNEQADPRPWTKLESIIILLIFSATGALSQQQPLHNLTELPIMENVLQFYHLELSTMSFVQISFQLDFLSIAMFSFALVLMAINVLGFRMKGSPVVSFLVSMVVIAAVYLGLMFSLQTY